jgi:rhodanese-related sulfurtransferase
MNTPAGFFSRVIRQAGGLVLLALVPAFFTAGFHPRRLAWSQDEIGVPEMTWRTAQRWRRWVLPVDARSSAAFASQHIPGALPLSEEQWEEQLPAVINAWRPGARVLVYCASQGCETSQSVAYRLHREMGIDDVFVLKGGWSAWLEAQPQRR